MSRKIAFLDLIFYIGLPLLVWNQGREYFGDYLAMLLSTVPGIIYTFYRFFKARQFNLIGIYIISTLLIGTTLDLLAGSAEQMLWNQIYFGLAIAGLHAFLLVIRKPLSLYFAVDFVSLQGHDREASKELFHQKGIFMWFQVIQSVIVIRGICLASLKIWLLQTYGIEAYDTMIVYTRVVGWIFGGLITALFIYTNVPINKYFQQKNIAS